MKRSLARSAMLLLAAPLMLLFLGVQGAPSGVSASGKASSAAAVAQARAKFIKVMSAHAPAVSASHGWVSPNTQGHGSVEGAANGSITSAQSINWSGYVASESGTSMVSRVSGDWTIPKIQCLPAPYENQDAFTVNWVGIDGFNNQTVEQLGTGAQCYAGVEYYFVFYEMYPAGTVEEGTTACISSNVDCPQPGDRISASVSVTAAGSGENNYNLALTDHTRPAESFSVMKQCATATCMDTSAEWIVERPAVVPPPPAPVQVLPLVDFTRTAFRNAGVASGGRATSILGFKDGPVYDISMIDDTDSYYLACVGQSAPPGTLLAITQANACPTVAPSPLGGFNESWDSSF